MQWDTEVASAGGAPASHRCTQVFCSALPIAYAHGVGKAEWEPLARLFLEAAYESTILVPPPPSRRHAIPRAHARARWRRRARASQVGASLALHRGTRVTVYLTSLGGGAFGNPPEWILKAMSRALDLCADMPVDVRLVHYGHYAGGDKFGMLERDARYL